MQPYTRRSFLVAAGAASLAPALAQAGDPLPSWNDGAAKRAILNLVATTTTPNSPNFVPAGQRIATFDQDGTTWVEHPIYTELAFSLNRVVQLAPSHPEWKMTQPFKAVLAGDKQAIANFKTADWDKIAVVTHSGMSVRAFSASVTQWITKARDPRWHRPYTGLIYQPMLEAMRFLRAHGYRTYIVTGGTQPFVRAYAQSVYGIPPEDIIGTTLTARFDTASARDVMMFAPKLLLNNNFSGKAEDIYLFTGARPQIAFGNTDGDAAMLEYTQAGGHGATMLLVLHDDPKREYAYGPAAGLPNTKVGSFSQALYDKAKASGWHIISMKSDWRRIFADVP